MTLRRKVATSIIGLLLVNLLLIGVMLIPAPLETRLIVAPIVLIIIGISTIVGMLSVVLIREQTRRGR